jgi:kynurenine formamidase
MIYPRLLGILVAFLTVCLVEAGSGVPKSEFGPDDELGAANRLSPAAVIEAAKLIKTGKTYPLGVETGPDTPAYGPRKFQMTILQLDDGVGKPAGDNQATGNDDMMYTYMGIGSQIDGLGHLGINHTYYNGVHAKDFVKVSGLTKFSTSNIPPIVCRGVLLDMAAYLGKAIVPEGTPFNEKEITGAAKAQGVVIQEGDVVLFHTGWLNIAESDPKRFMAGEPGLGMDGARFLAKKKIIAVGSDTFGLEALPFEQEGVFFPVHQELLTRNGIYLLENMDTRELAKDKGWEFLFVLGQPRFYGSVQSIINPVAIR